MADADHLLAGLRPGEERAGPRSAFHRTLDGIDDLFTATAVTIGRSMPELHAGYLAGDEAVVARSRDLARSTSERIGEVEHAAFVLLAREAPVGRDLRRLVAILRLVHDVERSAVLLRHVCGTLRQLDPRTLPPRLAAIVDQLGSSAGMVYARGVEAWAHRDALAVTEVDALDEHVDRLQLELYGQLAGTRGLGEEPLVVGLVARYYERLADHAVTIARDTAFVATGDRVVAAP